MPLNAASPTGLSSQEAQRRLWAEGFNELSQDKKRGALRTLLEILREPMILMLVACTAIYFGLGDASEALLLATSVVVIAGISFMQEHRAERTLEALRNLSSPRALVIRDGKQVRIAGREVVRGDHLLITEGDRVPADASLIDSSNLLADESLLSGESAPVLKKAGDTIYSGSLISRGNASAIVIATGSLTQIGRIGRAVTEITEESTALQKSTFELTRRIAIWAALLCVLFVGLYIWLHGHWIDGILQGLTLAIALMPEELPLILTVFFAMGAWRISRSQALTRRLSAIETLGSVQILGTDKTGTLTQNRMKVKSLWPADNRKLIQTALRASSKSVSDAMDLAIHEFASTDDRQAMQQGRLVQEFPLSPTLLAVTHVWNIDGKILVAIKGAPEHVLQRTSLTEDEKKRWLAHSRFLASEGQRVLAVASVLLESGTPVLSPDGILYQAAGLLAFEDPIRPEVPAAIQECRRAGIRVIMITGDHPETASAIARQIGFSRPEGVVTGMRLSEASDQDWDSLVTENDIFARVSPIQKLKIVRILRNKGFIVGMTGDGVNDGPCLKAADIGIAMGARGTDLARESAELVLLDDNFATIVKAIRLGRSIYQNIEKAASFIVAAHIPIAGAAILPLFTKGPAVLMTVHVIFLELIIDPACSLVFEAQAPQADLMTKPPRKPHAPLLSRRLFALSCAYGAIALAGASCAYAWAWQLDLSPASIRTATFLTLVVSYLGLIMTTLGRSPTPKELWLMQNQIFSWLILSVLAALVLVLFLPMLRDAFGFAEISWTILKICITSFAALMALLFGLKKIQILAR
jgi:P-type Ca2+ transporter type 2C